MYNSSAASANGRQVKSSAQERGIPLASGAAAGGVKKLVIKPFKVAPKISENFSMDTWAKLKSALSSVYSKSSSFVSKEELYQAVNDLCVQKLGARIYDLLMTELQGMISSKVALLQKAQVGDAKSFLRIVDEVWGDHVHQLNTTRNIFLYLDRSYALSAGVKMIWDAGNEMFKMELEKQPDVIARIISGLLATVDSHRQGEVTDSDVLGRLCRMLCVLQQYHQFEYVLLQDSVRYFSAEGVQLINAYDSARFLALVDRRLQECVDMCSRLLDASSRKPMLEIVETHLLQPHLTQLIEKGLKALLDGDRVEDLRRMYLLFGRVSGHAQLQHAWLLYCKQSGEAIVNNAEGHKTFVEDVLAMQKRLDYILKTSFFSQDSFKSSLKSAFEHFINLRYNSSASLIAKYVDRQLKGEKGVTEQEIESRLDQVMMLFRYLQEKDVFEAFYKKNLSKRLLLGKSANFDTEKNMLSKLKTECGSNYTAKLEGMFQDIDLSKACQAAYSAHLLQHPLNSALGGSTSMTMEMQVLTTGYWPSPTPTTTLILPEELTMRMQHFEQFYADKYQGRRLVWAHALQRCVVSARFPKGKKDLEVSFFQALVLRCFNRNNRLTFSEISEQTGIEKSELGRTLQSLACGMIGTRVLTKDPKGKDVDPTDAFWFNSDFTNKLFRIKINTIQTKETTEEVERTNEEVFRDREYQVDAAIVRTMKARKRLPHTTLISELLQQLRFPAQTSDLKRRIESLIERDYLARDPNEPSTYNYLA